MTLTDLARLVVEMRAAQRAYFKERRQGDLNRSKELESKVDRLCAEVLDDRPSLFDEKGAE